MPTCRRCRGGAGGLACRCAAARSPPAARPAPAAAAACARAPSSAPAWASSSPGGAPPSRPTGARCALLRPREQGLRSRTPPFGHGASRPTARRSPHPPCTRQVHSVQALVNELHMHRDELVVVEVRRSRGCWGARGRLLAAVAGHPRSTLARLPTLASVPTTAPSFLIAPPDAAFLRPPGTAVLRDLVRRLQGAGAAPHAPGRGRPVRALARRRCVGAGPACCCGAAGQRLLRRRGCCRAAADAARRQQGGAGTALRTPPLLNRRSPGHLFDTFPCAPAPPDYDDNKALGRKLGVATLPTLLLFRGDAGLVAAFNATASRIQDVQ